ncbi:MAG: hypothetical protein PHW64_06000 [Sulfuricurvum sp.]|nr:hypothetical protein [Sulfuricurvum sp.]
MKKLPLILSVVGIVLGAEEYTIQTISAHKEGSITPAFVKKVEKSTLPSTKMHEGNCTVMTVGHYKSSKEAHGDLKKGKAISPDAFVRMIKRPIPKSCDAGQDEVRSAVTVSEETNTTKTFPKKEGSAMDASKPKIDNGVMQSNASVSVPKAASSTNVPKAAASVSSVPVQPTEMKSSERQQEALTSPSCEKKTPETLRNERLAERKNDIHEAIEYYKNSPYYTFRPVIALVR